MFDACDGQADLWFLFAHDGCVRWERTSHKAPSPKAVLQNTSCGWLSLICSHMSWMNTMKSNGARTAVYFENFWSSRAGDIFRFCLGGTLRGQRNLCPWPSLKTASWGDHLDSSKVTRKMWVWVKESWIRYKDWHMIHKCFWQSTF